MISPCCGRKYHLSCIQGMASASGKHHFKCPACSVKEQFLEAAIAIGVYVPDQDAAWEKDSFYDFDAQGIKIVKSAGFRTAIYPGQV